MPDNPRDAELERRLETWLETWAASQPDAKLSPEIEQKVEAALSSTLTPVKPLPSHGKLVLAFLAVFAAGAAGLIAILDHPGFHLMTGAQMASMAAMLAGAGILFAVTVAWQMVPGSRPGFPLSLAVALSGVGVLGGIALLFPWRASAAFVPEGWPCALMELTIAIPAAGVFWLFARRGAWWGGAGAGAALGGLAVTAALLVLQFRCMFQQAPHLLAWHGGTAAILIGLGALFGEWIGGGSAHES
jgi:hypothetical protein